MCMRPWSRPWRVIRLCLYASWVDASEIVLNGYAMGAYLAYLRICVSAYLRSARMCCLPWRGAVFAIWYPNECPGSVWSRPALRISIDDIYVLPSLKYRRYCGIIVLKPKILYNIVWTFNKISPTGDQDKHHQKINCTFEAQSNIFKGCQMPIPYLEQEHEKKERTSNIYVQFILCVNICTSSTDVQLNLVVNILYCWANKLSLGHSPLPH